MFETVLLTVFLSVVDPPYEEPIPVESEVVSLIDSVELGFADPGIIIESRFAPGDRVNQGDLLARLDTIDAELEVQRVAAELEQAKLNAANDLSIQLSEKSYAVAITELTRAEKANEKFAATVSNSEIDRLRLARDEAELQVRQAQFEKQQRELQVALKSTELEIAQHRLEKLQLVSPMDGIVVRVEGKPGERAHPDKPMFRIVNTQRLRVEGLVSISAPAVKVGDTVTVIVPTDKEGRAWPGKIMFVDPEVDTITGQYRIWAEVQNHDQWLRAGLRPEMKIHHSRQLNAQTIEE